MPTIPKPSQIGEVGVQNTRRVVDVPVDPTGQAVSQFGRAAEEVADRVQRARTAAELADADLDATRALAEIERAGATDKDPLTFQSRARAQAERVFAERGKTLSGVARQAWNLRSKEALGQFEARASEIGRRRNVDLAKAQLIATGEKSRLNALDMSLPPEKRQEAEDGFRFAVRHYVSSGVLSEAEGASLLVDNDRFLRTERGKMEAATLQTKIDAMAGILATAPERFDELTTKLLSEISASPNVDPDVKVRLSSITREGAAISTVQSLIRRDPYGALKALNSKTAGGAFAALGDKRGDLLRSAQTEVDRRTAEWKGSIRDQISAIDDLIEAGKPLPSRLSVETVRSALGENMAAAYQSKLATYDAYQGLAMAPQADILRTLVDPKATPEQRRAAELAAKQRKDGTQFLIQRGVLPPGNIAVNLATAVQDQDPAKRETALKGFLDELRPRVSRTMTLQSGLGVPAQVLTQQEAGLLSSALSPMKPVRERQQLLEQIRVAAGPAGFSAIMQQISGDKSLVAYAGNLSTVERRIGNLTGQTAAQAILRGENILASDLKASLPDKELETQWQSAVGTAYRGAASAEEQAKAAYRAAYASLAQDAGVLNGAMNKDLATQAIRIATGGIEEINKKKTVVPWGMPASVFMDSVKAGWPRITAMKGNEALRNVRLQDVTFRALGNGQYAIENVAREDGSPIEIRVDGAVVRPPRTAAPAPGVSRGGADE